MIMATCESSSAKKPPEARPSLCRLGVLLAILTATLSAQTGGADWNTVKALTSGTEVRIAAGSRSVRGEIERATDDVLVLNSRQGQEMFDRQQISSVSVKKPSRRTKHTLLGLAAGTGAGLVVAFATVRSESGTFEIVTPATVRAAFTAAGAIVGTVVGALIPTGGWREIYRK
jgi:hypothetical protein